MADPAIAPSVLLKRKALLEDEDGLARAVGTAFFKHVFTRCHARSIGFSYWRGKRHREVDITAATDGWLVPFEVKYRSTKKTGPPQLRGMAELCAERRIDRGYVITREWYDVGTLDIPNARLLRIPARLACYWLGPSEFDASADEPG